MCMQVCTHVCMHVCGALSTYETEELRTVVHQEVTPELGCGCHPVAAIPQPTVQILNVDELR